MSKFKPTDSQQLFIDCYNKNTLVSASAGSGKTSTMINKLTDMIVNHGVELRKLLVVTYTNSAGSEMKQKLFNSLVDELQQQEDPTKVDFISQQIDDMANCDIGTLHGVCKKIITNYFYVVEQDPTFALLNEQQSTYLYDNAMLKVFNEYITENNDEFYAIYSLFNKKRNLTNLMTVVKSLHNYLISKVDANEWKKYVVEQCCVSGNSSETYLFEYFKTLFLDYKNQFIEFKQKCKNYFNYYLDYVSDKLNFVLGVENAQDYERLYTFINAYNFLKKPKIYTAKISVDDLELVEQVDQLIDEFNKTLKLFNQNCFLMDKNDYKKYQNIILKIFELVDKVEMEYRANKKQQNALDFSDLEHITLEILDNEKVSNALREKYDYIFVDEYQDINQVQETIISKIKRDTNLFMIGDVKQSIYAFRLSSPEIFIDKFNRFLVEKDENELINLNENFRSEKNILEFSNMVFNKLITNETIGIDYQSNSQLIAGSEKEFNKCVSMDIIDNKSKISEGQVIANKVGDLVKEGYNFKDIAILLRSKGNLVNEIYSELKKYNIPCEATYKVDLFKNSEVLVLFYLLKLVNNFNNDIALATVLKSLFVKLSDNELAEIRMINKDACFYECAYQYMDEGSNEHIKNKLLLLNEFISDIRLKLSTNTIIETLNYFLTKHDVFNYYLSFVDGLEKISHIKEFLKIVSNEEYKYDIQKCIDYLDNIKKAGEVTITLSGTGDSVKIMTIHSSKGLEYPAVILGGTGKQFVLNKQTEDIIINDKLGVGVKLFDSDNHLQRESLIRKACKLNNKKNEIDEEVRLLYVALTRAKSRLCIVGEYDTNNLVLKSSKNLYTSHSYLDMIFKSLPKEELIKFENKVDNFVVNKDKSSVFEVSFIKEVDEDVRDDRNIIFAQSDEQIESVINSYYDYVYPHNTNNNIALKNSVSQVLKEEQDYENQVDNIQLDALNDNYSLKLGTAYHNIMQNLNYCENKAEIQELFNRVKSDDLPYQDIDIDKILNAVKNVSKLFENGYKLMKEAQFVMKANYGDLTDSNENVDVLIQGVIDLIIINGDNAIIIDFKTNKTRSEQYLIDKYAMQLKMYSDAFAKAYNVNIKKKLLYSFEMEKFIEIC